LGEGRFESEGGTLTLDSATNASPQEREADPLNGGILQVLKKRCQASGSRHRPMSIYPLRMHWRTVPLKWWTNHVIFRYYRNNSACTSVLSVGGFRPP